MAAAISGTAHPARLPLVAPHHYARIGGAPYLVIIVAPGARRLRKPAQAATKLVIIDELIVVAGSTNYTGPANLYNDENIFVTGSTREEVSGVEVEVTDRKIGGFFKAEIERIIGFCEPYDPAA
ncbi:MAG: hypothetical protein ACRDGD_11385 [Candidatus Limnocylindria bacterium]